MQATNEKVIQVRGGFGKLAQNLALLLFATGLLIAGPVLAESTRADEWLWLILFGLLTLAAAIVSLCGHFTLQPNEARVLMLFGDYRGTVRESGFYWTNPFYTKTRISLRARNFDGATIKVIGEL